MRTFIFLLCATAFAFAPDNGFSQDATITVERDQILSIEEVFDLIKSQTDYLFVYRYDSMRDAPLINLKKGNLKTSDLLDMGLHPIGYTFRFVDNTIIVSKQNRPQLPLQEKVTVTGEVRDEMGIPLEGTTVMIKETRKAVSANGEGEFVLPDVDVGATLVFTHVGFMDKEVVITPENANNLIVILKEALNELDEVVLVSTGYQTISKERSAGSFSKPDIDVLQNRTNSMNVLERLDGLVPGLVINNAPSGRVQGNSLLIRGLSTVSLNSIRTTPLIVVDGIPIADIGLDEYNLPQSGIVNINPQDIEDITVLKDATAASIWGARAANGVIVINTKKGRTSGDISIQYDSFVTMEQRPDMDYLKTLNSKEYIQAAEDIFDPERNPYSSVTAYTTSGSGIPPHEQILYDRYRGVISEGTARRRLDSLASIDNRNQIERLWYRPSVLTSHTLSVSGGKNKYSFYGSANYTGTQSHSPGEKDNRYKLNLRQNFGVGKRINIDLITDLTYQKQHTPNNIDVDSRFLPYQLFRDANGNNLEMSYMTELNDSIRTAFEDASQIDLSYTPLDEVNYAYTDNTTKIIRNIVGVDVDIIDGLKFQGKYGYTTNSIENERYTDHLTIDSRTEMVEFTQVSSPGAEPQYILPTTGGKYRVTTSRGEAWTVRNQLSYIKDWNNKKHQLNLIAGQEAQEQFSVLKMTQVRGYDDRLQTYEQKEYSVYVDPVFGNGLVSNVVKPTSISHPVFGNFSSINNIINERYFSRSETTTRFTSYYANAAYTYNRKYSVNGSVRNDQSNLFGLDKSAQNRPVWSVGGKWNIGRESFLQDVNWLDVLAFRASYGIAGNAPNPGTAASFDILRAEYNAIFRFPEPGLTISTPGNSKLSWERTVTTNYGVDFGFFTRMSGSLDYYKRKTTDLLGTIPTNPFTGYSSVTGNLGDLENEGIEITLQTRNIVLNNFSWVSTLNLAFNKNTITALYLQDETTSGDYRVKNESFVEGYPAYALFAYDYVGLDENGDPQIRLADGTITTDPNVTTPEDVKFMGTYQPKWNGGFGNTFRYKNLSLNVNTVFSLGHVMRRDVNRYYAGTRLKPSNYNFITGNISEEFTNRWMEPGDEAFTDIPRHVDVEDGSRDTDYYVYGDNNIISGSFIKIRDINLIYNLPSSVFKNTGIDQITLRGQISNILLWANNDDDIDPEYYIPYSGYRTLKPGERLTLGLNVKF
ncbi:SusC/RagA family TonB-linked outer membrane protein [Abyssalbus ytuae]|uniref:SusC/RagA family TonB-linked outer membrane protein n=1 Tax=Abyssalbus ytuae TaxID=2926907 RepID=A0A9E7CSQ8_9FLAO|nr:SusC/RagA family TonB-linked outer membrane protein [Abyssalbus ytuae]UOB16676.1 SusC/RagA family TonB-linked outer membrane protein [Abyssalbus ytuae]